MSLALRIARMQEILRRHGIAGWFFSGGPGADPVFAAAFPGIAPAHPMRRWACIVPAEGSPVRILHEIEPDVLAGMPGTARAYRSRDQWLLALRVQAAGLPRLAAQYVPRGEFPAVDVLPGGLTELLREAGAEVVSAAPLMPELAVLAPDEAASHDRAAAALTRAVAETLDVVAGRAGAGVAPTEIEVQSSLVARLTAAGLLVETPPIVAFGSHTALPHYSPSPADNATLAAGDLVLIDAWAKEPIEEAIYADITWMAVAAREPEAAMAEKFSLLTGARDRAVSALDRTAREGRTLTGASVDELVRGLLESAGEGRWFAHRTGHSLSTSVHGPGTNLDSIETRDDRPLLPGAAFTIEPGLYWAGKHGMRTEINVRLEAAGALVTTTPFQTAIRSLLR